jgi:nitrate/nitrite transporter NarK
MAETCPFRGSWRTARERRIIAGGRRGLPARRGAAPLLGADHLAPGRRSGQPGGMMNFAGNVGGILVPIIVGVIVQVTGSYFLTLMFFSASGVLYLIGSLMMATVATYETVADRPYRPRLSYVPPA